MNNEKSLNSEAMALLISQHHTSRINVAGWRVAPSGNNCSPLCSPAQCLFIARRAQPLHFAPIRRSRCDTVIVNIVFREQRVFPFAKVKLSPQVPITLITRYQEGALCLTGYPRCHNADDGAGVFAAPLQSRAPVVCCFLHYSITSKVFVISNELRQQIKRTHVDMGPRCKRA